MSPKTGAETCIVHRAHHHVLMELPVGSVYQIIVGTLGGQRGCSYSLLDRGDRCHSLKKELRQRTDPGSAFLGTGVKACFLPSEQEDGMCQRETHPFVTRILCYI